MMPRPGGPYAQASPRRCASRIKHANAPALAAGRTRTDVQAEEEFRRRPAVPPLLVDRSGQAIMPRFAGPEIQRLPENAGRTTVE
jgi:hypothetical protein